MSDYGNLPLLDRLRWRYAGIAEVGELNRAMREAADEITSLRTLLAEMRGAVALAIVHDEYGADEWRGIKARLEAALGDQP